MAHRGTPAVFVLVLLMLPTAAGQGPATCSPAVLDQPTPGIDVAPGAEGRVAFGVTNPNRTPATADIRLNPAYGGWTWSPDRTTVSLGAGANATVTLLLAAPADAATGHRAVSITVEVVLRCDVAGLATAGTSGAAAIGFDAFLAGPPPSRGDGGAGGFDAFELIVLGALVVSAGTAATLVARQTRKGFRVRTEEQEKPVEAGRGASFPVTVENLATGPDTAILDVSAVPDGWNAFMAMPEVPLAGREARQLWVMVRAPPGAEPGERVDVRVDVRSKAAPGKASSATLTAVVAGPGGAAGAAEGAGASS